MIDTEAPAEPDAAYKEIEAALARTATGRRFLSEHARRSRGGDTQLLLDAVSRLERRVAGTRLPDEMERLREDLAEMGDVIRRTKTEIADLRQPPGDPARLSEASEALDGVVRTTERATSDILDATEQIQETAWTMREGGFDAALCDALDQRATEIYAACAFQDLTAQRVDRVVRSLAFIESRIGSMNRIWGADGPARPRPPLDGHKLALSQTDIDFVIVDAEEGPAGATGRASADAVPEPRRDQPSPPASQTTAREKVLAELERLEALSTRDRLRLFT